MLKNILKQSGVVKVQYPKYKRSDLVLLTSLRSNARYTLTELSRLTKIPISTVFDKIRNYETTFITKYAPLIDFTKFGFFARASVVLKVGKQHLDQAKVYLLNHPNVNSLYKINNGFDFQVELVFRHMQELEEFLDLFSRRFAVKQIITFYLIDEIKKESFLTSMNSADMIDLTYHKNIMAKQ